MNFQTILYDCCRKKIFFKNYSCWRINTVKWRVGIQRAIDTMVSERDLFSRGKSLAREWVYIIHSAILKIFNAFIQLYFIK